MSQPTSTKVTLAQCTGVTPAPVCQPANLSQREANEQKFPSVHAAQQIDSRQPLHDNNSQTSPCSTHSHKRSRTTSDSIVITPSEKRQTVLALSPERPLPAGQQWTTLEVQRVLSLTPGTRPALKHSDCQHGSLETIQTNTAHNSPASCSPDSTVAADDSPMRHTINMPSTEAKASDNEQQGTQSMMPTDAFPATELQLPDIPPTQLACAATALDLLLCESTQVVGDPASAVIASKPSSAGAAGGYGGLPNVSAQQELALNLFNAEGLTATPVMMLAPAQMINPADKEAVTHSRAPAGPVASPVATRQAVFGTARQGAPAPPAPAGLSAAAVVAKAALEGQPQIQHADETSASLTNAQQQGPKPVVSGTKHAATGNQQQEQQASQAPQQEADRAHQPNEGLLLQHHCLPLTSTEPPLGTEDTASQESLEGTQAEADALIEESSYWVINVNDDEGHEERAWGALVLHVSQSTFAEVAAALGQPFSSWTKTKSFSAVDRLLWAARIHVDQVNFSFEGGLDTLPLSPETDWVEGEMCSPSEAAERLAMLEAEGHITFAHHPPFSCSAAGSSAPGFELTEGTQLGTVTEEAAAIINYSQAGSPTQCMDDAMADITATEVQLPPSQCLELPLSPQAAAAGSSAPAAEVPAAQVTTVADTVEFPAAEHNAVEEDLPVQESAALATTPAEMHVPAQSHQPLPDSPTQNLHLHLTCLESQTAEEQFLPAVASPPLQQLRLHLTDVQVSQAAQHAEQRAEHGVDEPCEVFNSPARLSLNLDTQLPDQELVPPASKAVPGDGLQRSPQPAARRSWWGQPWSVAKQPDEIGPSPIGGVWGALTDLDVAAEGTEVTPSGLRLPRGPSSTPLPQPATSDASPYVPSSRSAGRAPTPKPQGRSTQQELTIADSEEPLVLHRQHGPAKRAFLDAHALPCSSPNSPPDPLCSYVPASADGASLKEGAQKKSGYPKARSGKVGEIAAVGVEHVPMLADDEAFTGGAGGHGKQGKHAARPGKGRSKRKTKAAPQMGPPGARYRAGLPAPRYQSHHPKPRTTPPLPANRLQPQNQILGHREAAAHQQEPLPALESADKDAVALHGCTTEQLLLGATAFNSCTLEQLPQGSRVCSPAVASPFMDRSSSPVVMSAGMLAGHGPGLGAGLHGAGFSARHAVAALCSARRQTAEPRNAYSFPDSLSPPAEADGAEPLCSSPTGVNGTAPAQQAKHGQHRSSAVAMVQLPDATGRLQAPCVAEDRMASAPPQQSRPRWHLKASAQANAAKQQLAAAPKLSKQHPVAAEASARLASREGKGIDQAQLSAAHGKVGARAGRKRGRDTGSIALDKLARKRQPPPRYDDMVGHSQLDSDMLQASPQALADRGNVANNAAGVNGDVVDYNEESAVHAEDSNEEGMEGFADEALAMPEPGCKGKRSKLQHSRMQALLIEAADPGSEPAAAAASPVIPVRSAGQLKVKLPPLGCSKCRWSAKGCKKCRHDREADLQAVGAADAEGAIPAAQPAREALKAVAKPGFVQAAPFINQPAQAPHHASPVPAEPVTNRHGRRKTRGSADPELLGQTRGNASVSPAPAEASKYGPVTARHRRSGGLAPAEHPLPVQQTSQHKRKSGSAAADVERAKKVMVEQRRAAPSSPAVVQAAAGQGRKAGQGRADQQDRQGRAAPDSPALSSPGSCMCTTCWGVDTGGSRAMQRHRRSSLGGGGVLPFAGHSFLLTAYSDEKQKERICHKITQLGGYVLEDVPKPQGSRRASLGGGTPSHPVLALFSGQPIRTTKIMYAYIKGIPIVKECWLLACVSAHKLLPFDALDLEGGKRNEGHQAFQGLRLHLAGSPRCMQSFGRLVQHAGGHLVSGVGDSTSPGGVHHALQAPCNCILSDFPVGSDELQQVHRLARRLRVPVKDKMWAIIGFEEGQLPPPSPTKPSTLPPSSPPLPSALTTSLPTGQATGGHTRQAAAVANTGSAARRQSRGDLHASHAHGDADNGMPSRSGKIRTCRKVDLVIPESEQQFEEERAGSAWAAHPAGPEAEEAQVDQLHDDRAVATAGRQQPRHLRNGGEQGGLEGLCNAAGRGVIVADSMEFGSCMAATSADIQDEVSSGDTNNDHQAGQVLLGQQLQPPQAEQHQLHDQPLQQAYLQLAPGPMQQQQGNMVIAGLSGAAGGNVEQQAGGAGQLLSGDIQWVGPSIEPPTGLGLTPSQHQTFYAAFARGGVVVRVGDFVELSPVPGEDLNRLVQVAALWSEPTQARQRMLASCHRFYRASETCIQYGFPPHEVFSSQDIEAKVPLLAVLCKCSIVYGRNGPTGNHNYLCPFSYDYASNSLRGH
ncbi:hypothetical protein WJX77_003852 [Trebouxia sp. C0004]